MTKIQQLYVNNTVTAVFASRRNDCTPMKIIIENFPKKNNKAIKGKKLSYKVLIRSNLLPTLF